MVPLRLRLRNFMCYRDVPEPLELEGIHIACLTGNNGHGKSALLDAMTWALWGKSRSDSDDDLIYVGQPDMEVELTFRVGEGTYRVIRKRARPRTQRGAGTSTLDFQAIGPDGEPMPITGGVLRETQQKIIETVRMDYDTFTNSAFLMQGRADAFTLKSPGDRKKVLGEILGLGRYDVLEERARAEQREAEARHAQATRDLEVMDAELQDRPQVASELDDARRRVELLSVELTARQETVRLLQERRRGDELLAAQANDLDRRIATGRANLDGFVREAARHARDIERLSAVAERRDDILTGLEELRRARAEVEADTNRLSEVRRLEAEANQHERVVEASRSAVAGDVRMLRLELDQARPRADAIGRLEDELVTLGHDEEKLEADRKALEDRTEAVQEQRSQTLHLRETNTRLRAEMEELKVKHDQIMKLDDQALCPLCGTALGPDGRDHIVAQYQAEGKVRADQYRTNDGLLKAIEAEAKRAQVEIANRTNVLQRTQTAQGGRRIALVKELNEARQARDLLVNRSPKLQELEALLAAGEFAKEEQQAADAARAQIRTLGYDEATHATRRRHVEQLTPYETQARDLSAAEQGLSTAREAKERAEALAAQMQLAMEEDTARLVQLRQELTGADEVRARLLVAERDLQQTTAGLAQRQQQVGALTQRQERLERMASLRQDRAQDQEEARRDRDAYADLVTAFGKRGIQALLIETALPELESGANELLGRMTANRMSVRLESQRTSRAGNVSETLDIKIADELGTRDYDLFSGGEAFRINFALRVALSKLLARRAGAPLPTLIVDEGFGSQDQAGREKLVEVLNAIQDDFECILVITHIEELKEVFPVRIEVTKAAEGSSYQLVV